MQTSIRERFSIDCGGVSHEVYLTRKGQLAFSGHTKQEIRRLKILYAMGDRSCPCVGLCVEWGRSQHYGSGITHQPAALVKADLYQMGGAGQLQRRFRRTRPLCAKAGEPCVFTGSEHGLSRDIASTKEQQERAIHEAAYMLKNKMEERGWRMAVTKLKSGIMRVRFKRKGSRVFVQFRTTVVVEGRVARHCVVAQYSDGSVHGWDLSTISLRGGKFDIGKLAFLMERCWLEQRCKRVSGTRAVADEMASRLEGQFRIPLGTREISMCMEVRLQPGAKDIEEIHMTLGFSAETEQGAVALLRKIMEAHDQVRQLPCMKKKK